MNADFDARLERIAALAEPVRRALFRHVAAQVEPVSREQAAAAVGVARHVAKFHLDRLVDDGLLQADYCRPPGRSGPGAGRPAKMYRRGADDLEVSVPERRYDLAGRLLARAVAESARTGSSVEQTVHDVARAAGRDAAVAKTAGRRRKAAVATALRALGYEPQSDGKDLVLTNCPFHRLAQDETELICGMNVDFVEGLLDGVGAGDLQALLDPAPGRCCVRITRR